MAQQWGANVVQSFPIENGPPIVDVPPVDGLTSIHRSETNNSQTFAGTVITDDHLYPEVKNVNFFGVDRDKCCDEWAGMCNGKSLKYSASCGGLKANKGHLGIRWLKGKFGGEDCDYCKGGCCEKGCAAKQSRPIKSCLKKYCRKNSGDKKCDCNEQPTQTEIFGRPLKSNCDRCGCCEEGCQSEEYCESCK